MPCEKYWSLEFTVSLHKCDLMRVEKKRYRFIFYFLLCMFYSDLFPLYVHGHSEKM